MYRHHNFEERLNVVRRILCGEPIKSVCRSLSLDENLVRQWYLRYKKYGEEGLRGTRSYHYSAKEKAMIVKEYAEKGITLHEICLRYNLNRSTIKCWIRKVRKGLSLENKQRGRPPKEPMARPKKKEPQTELEKLQAENLRLRAENALLKKSEGLSRGTGSPSTAQWTKAIDGLRSVYPLDLLLKLRKMARSVFYYHLKHLKSKDKYEDERKSIRLIFHEHKGRYGYRRVTAEMRNRGHKINHKTVQRLMNEMGLKCKIRKVRYRSYKGEVGKIAPNIIKRNFIATAPNRKWATDVTQINVGTAKLYLSPIVDMFNGEIVSYNISTSPNLEQIYDMLDKAFAKYDCLDGLILHSDQGWQYQHYGYRKRLEEHHIVQSMSRKGNCLDNAVAENFFGIMKSELLYAEKLETPEVFMKALEEYIDYYNNKRIKSRLKGKSPVQYQTLSQNG